MIIYILTALNIYVTAAGRQCDNFYAEKSLIERHCKIKMHAFLSTYNINNCIF
jgi:hypothetical protein